MTNVLPSFAKRNRATRIRARFLVVGGLVGILAACVGALSLVPAYVMVRAGTASAPTKESTGLDAQATRAEAAKTRGMLEVLAPFRSDSSIVQGALLPLLAHRPSGVSIDRIEFSEGARISVSGSLESRDALNEFRTSVAEDAERFASVSVPVASLIGTEEGRFIMTVEVRR